MTTIPDYAILSALIYNDVRQDKNKLLPLPNGWNEILYDSNPGFTAGAYRYGNEIVVAFKRGESVPQPHGGESVPQPH